MTVEDIRRYAFKAYLKYRETMFYKNYTRCRDYLQYLLEHENNFKRIIKYDKLIRKLDYILRCIRLMKNYFFTGDE
jgi:hypothetical protein